MQCHDVSWLDALGQTGEITDHALNAIGQLTPPRFACCRVEICGRRVDESRRSDALREKLEGKDADASTDVEHGVGVPDLVGYGIKQQSRRRVRTLSPVTFQITRSDGWTELALGIRVP